MSQYNDFALKFELLGHQSQIFELEDAISNEKGSRNMSQLGFICNGMLVFANDVYRTVWELQKITTHIDFFNSIPDGLLVQCVNPSQFQTPIGYLKQLIQEAKQLVQQQQTMLKNSNSWTIQKSDLLSLKNQAIIINQIVMDIYKKSMGNYFSAYKQVSNKKLLGKILNIFKEHTKMLQWQFIELVRKKLIKIVLNLNLGRADTVLMCRVNKFNCSLAFKQKRGGPKPADVINNNIQTLEKCINNLDNENDVEEVFKTTYDICERIGSFKEF